MKIITKSDYYTLIGLREISARKWREIQEMEQLAAQIVGEEDTFGHASDYLAGSRELDDMLEILKISVK